LGFVTPNRTDLSKISAIILAGGEGTRFKPYTDLVPKPMIPVGVEERPILEHIICWLKRFDVTNYVLLVGYKWKQVRNYFGDGSRHGVRIKYSVDDEVYRGTGGALLKAYKTHAISEDVALIWYGDILAPINVKNLVEFHRNENANVTLVVSDKYQVPVGVANIDSAGNVVELSEKPWLNLYVTIGVLTLETSILKHVEASLGRSFDIMGDLIPWMIKKGYRVKAYIHRDLWYDVGSLEKYVKIDYERIKHFLCEFT
jgi:Nucleoside-diphosphate-sugar pyrophosphorylase involved in lipopolysaccharide biosynthesis/translation initiation factor 2B, gamma/epsilon subunits (eIF-2Bgamma/eIF-2Bepsilon)